MNANVEGCPIFLCSLHLNAIRPSIIEPKLNNLPFFDFKFALGVQHTDVGMSLSFHYFNVFCNFKTFHCISAIIGILLKTRRHQQRIIEFLTTFICPQLILKNHFPSYSNCLLFFILHADINEY